MWAKFPKFSREVHEPFFVDPVLFFDLYCHLLSRQFSRISGQKGIAVTTISNSYLMNSMVLPCIQPVVPSSVVTRYHGLFPPAGFPIFTGASKGITETSGESIDGEDRRTALIMITRPLKPFLANRSFRAWSELSLSLVVPFVEGVLFAGSFAEFEGTSILAGDDRLLWVWLYLNFCPRRYRPGLRAPLSGLC